MKTLKNVLKWLFGLFFLISGIGGLFTSSLFGLVCLLMGLFILPPSLKMLEKKISYSFSSQGKVSVVIVGVVLLGFASLKDKELQDSEVDEIVLNASLQIDMGNMDSALVLIEKAKRAYSNSTQNKAIELEEQIEMSNSEVHAKEVLGKMTDNEFKKLKSNKLNKAYLSQRALNQSFIELLIQLSPDRAEIVKEVKEQEEREQIAAEQEAARLEAEQRKQEREELINKQFSSWDGSHRGLTKVIKQSMHDPDSYEHVETRFGDYGDYILVVTKFRGNNKFGATVLSSVSAKVDFNGNVIEVVNQ